MKVKNVRLKFKDLHPGRVVYMAEPGYQPVKIQIVQKTSSILEYDTIALLTSKDGSTPKVVGNPVSREVAISAFPKLAESTREFTHAVFTKYRVHQNMVTYRLLAGAPEQIGTIESLVYYQLDPHEFCTRVFRSLKQAEQWCAFPISYCSGKESAFVRPELEQGNTGDCE